MRKILVIFAHPRLENSRVNIRLLEQITARPEITLNDLYERYPDFNVEAEYEKVLLTKHDVIIWHHPLYWYSSPPLIKQWIDIVLEYGWAYGTGGDKLQDKIIFNAITAGGGAEAYNPEGYNKYTLFDFMHPFEQTAKLCLMNYLPPFTVLGTNRMGSEDIERASDSYGRLLDLLAEDRLDLASAGHARFLNDVITGNGN